MTDARRVEALRRVARDEDYLRYLAETIAELSSEMVLADRMEDIRSVQGMARGCQKVLSELEKHHN